MDGVVLADKKADENEIQVALKEARKLAKFYIDAGEPFVRLKQSLMHDTNFDYQVLIDNWFSAETQAKVKSVVSSLSKK